MFYAGSIRLKIRYVGDSVLFPALFSLGYLKFVFFFVEISVATLDAGDHVGAE